MNYQQKVVQAKELLQQIKENGGTPYFADTFKYDRDMGWLCKADYAQEIEWCDFNYRSHKTGLIVYRNLNDVIKYLHAEINLLFIRNNPTEENMMWAGDEQGYVFVED
jgi:hypothetical protein